MRGLSFLIPTITVVVLAACSSGQARPFGKPETDAINELIANFVVVYNAKDATKVSRLFTDGGAVMPPNTSTRRGTENVRVYYVDRFNQGATDLVLEPQTIAGSGLLAFASGDYRLNMSPPGGV